MSLLLGLLMQILDGSVTYYVVNRYGLEYEINPLVHTLMVIGGAGMALISLKTYACFAYIWLFVIGAKKVLIWLNVIMFLVVLSNFATFYLLLK